MFSQMYRIIRGLVNRDKTAKSTIMVQRPDDFMAVICQNATNCACEILLSHAQCKFCMCRRTTWTSQLKFPKTVSYHAEELISVWVNYMTYLLPRLSPRPWRNLVVADKPPRILQFATMRWWGSVSRSGSFTHGEKASDPHSIDGEWATKHVRRWWRRKSMSVSRIEGQSSSP
jgi:hypothetical protein